MSFWNESLLKAEVWEVKQFNLKILQSNYKMKTQDLSDFYVYKVLILIISKFIGS